jgi:hypothetical protein
MDPEDVPPATPADPDDGAGPAEPAAVAADPGAVAPTLPSPLARLVGFAAILAAGAAGGFIGYAVTDIQCRGDCTVSRGLGGLAGAVIAAVGVAVVVQLALRAMHEWRVIEARGGAPARRRPAGSRPPTSRPRPRVR